MIQRQLSCGSIIIHFYTLSDNDSPSVHSNNDNDMTCCRFAQQPQRLANRPLPPRLSATGHLSLPRCPRCRRRPTTSRQRVPFDRLSLPPITPLLFNIDVDVLRVLQRLPCGCNSANPALSPPTTSNHSRAIPSRLLPVCPSHQRPSDSMHIDQGNGE